MQTVARMQTMTHVEHVLEIVGVHKRGSLTATNKTPVSCTSISGGQDSGSTRFCVIVIQH